MLKCVNTTIFFLYKLYHCRIITLLFTHPDSYRDTHSFIAIVALTHFIIVALPSAKLRFLLTVLKHVGKKMRKVADKQPIFKHMRGSTNSYTSNIYLRLNFRHKKPTARSESERQAVFLLLCGWQNAIFYRPPDVAACLTLAFKSKLS